MTQYAFEAALRRGMQPLIDLALAEDLGTGDITSATTIPATAEGSAVLTAKSSGVLAGMPVALRVMHSVDPRITFHPLVDDGRPVTPKERLAEMHGPVRSLLTAERTALNFLQRMSGIATTTAKYVQAVAGTRAQIVDTRKTLPGHRMLDKYAVRAGGGRNHRFNLSDGVLIKDNHIAAVGGIVEAINTARLGAPHTIKIEIEVESLEMAQTALEAGADIIMLDNMTTEQMRACVEMIAGRALTEASGGVTLESVRAIAECGVDLISVGALTHSVTALDISMDFEG